MPKPCSDEHQCAIAGRESSYNSRSSSDLADDPLKWSGGPDLAPMVGREQEVCRRLLAMVFHQFRSSRQLAFRLATTSTFFARADARSSWAWMALSILAT